MTSTREQPGIRDSRRPIPRAHVAAAAGACLVGFTTITLLLAVHWRPLARLDVAVTLRLTALVEDRPRAIEGLTLATNLFSPWSFRAVGLVLGVGLALVGAWRLGLWVLVAIWGGGFLAGLTKTLADRPRPWVPEPVASVGGLSYPSGHALGAVVGCAVILALVWTLLSRAGRVLATAVAVTVVLFTSFTRVALGVHYTSDVLAGMVLGLAWVAATAAVLRPAVLRSDAGPPGRAGPGRLRRWFDRSRPGAGMGCADRGRAGYDCDEAGRHEKDSVPVHRPLLQRAGTLPSAPWGLGGVPLRWPRNVMQGQPPLTLGSVR